jgi:hypothetical protein
MIGRQNMSIFLITYDLKKPGQDYSDFIKTIKGYTWARLSESSYAINTQEAPKEIYDKLLPHLDKNDQLYIVTLKIPYFGMGPKDVNDWLSKFLQ